MRQLFIFIKTESRLFRGDLRYARNLKNPLLGVVAPVSDSNPMNSKHYSQGHDLILTQRVLGRSHTSMLGYVQSYMRFD